MTYVGPPQGDNPMDSLERIKLLETELARRDERIAAYQQDFAEMTRRAMRLEEERAYLEQANDELQETARLLRGELIQLRQDHDHPTNPVED